jgi:hypothetical protein
MSFKKVYLPDENVKAYLESSKAARVASRALLDGFPYLP